MIRLTLKSTLMGLALGTASFGLAAAADFDNPAPRSPSPPGLTGTAPGLNGTAPGLQRQDMDRDRDKDHGNIRTDTDFNGERGPVRTDTDNDRDDMTRTPATPPPMQR